MSPLKFLCIVLVCGVIATLQAQQQPKPGDMQVRINYLNVCTPSDADKQEIAVVLERIPTSPRFGPEFEIARGRSVAPDAPIASWVRVRREFPGEGALTNAQYSISADEKGITETVVFRWREPKDVMQVSIEDSVGPGNPVTVVSTDTPASRIRVERFGKSSLGLARCAQADQSAYEGIFSAASRVLSRYRVALAVRESVPPELARLGLGKAQARIPKKASTE